MSDGGDLPYGEIQGYGPGNVAAVSNGSDMHFSAEREFLAGVYVGFKGQCVNYGRRALMVIKGLLLPDVSWAAHIYSLTEVQRLSDGEPVRMVANRNGASTTAPVADALLIYPSSEGNMVGHVAWITEVGDGWLRIADQNHRFHRWAGNYSAQLPVVFDAESGTYTVKDSWHDEHGVLKEVLPLGWMTFPDTPNRADFSAPLEVAAKFLAPSFPPPTLERVTFVPKDPKDNWLDLTNAAQAQFVKTFGMDVSRTRLNEAEANYYRMNVELWFACVRAGNDLHRIFVEQTARVVASDELLRRFGIPEEFWPRVRSSFATQKKCITGRFDFAFDDATGALKCFEYNADSASTLLECGVIQDKWATSVGIDAENTRSSGFRMGQLLEHAWAESGVPKGSRVHFCVDDDDEEQYTALFCMEKAAEAGLQPKLCVMFDEFVFNDAGVVVDRDGVPVRYIWKTWMWESGFKDFFAAREQRGAGWRATPADKVRLTDLILNPDETIVVFEPLWKVIPSNKAILPMIWEANPTHPNILRAEYELSDELRRTGYARKPIVGRVGSNITVVAPGGGETLLESEGKFSDRDTIYQELVRLPKRDGYHAILGGWMIGAEYGGTGIREDKTIITGVESPFSALRVVVNFNIKPVTHESIDEKEASAAAAAAAAASEAVVEESEKAAAAAATAAQ